MRFNALLRYFPLVLLCACSGTSTRVTSSWKTPALSEVHDVLVLAVTGDQAIRTQYENEFMAHLQEHGVRSIPSYTVATSTSMFTRKEIAQINRENNIDTVLVARLVGHETEKSYVPGSVPPDRFYNYYANSYGYIESPEYPSTKIIRMETNLFNARTGQRIWDATTDTSTQNGDSAAIRSFIETIIVKMKKDGLLK